MALRITGLGEEIAAVTGLPWNLPLEEWPEDPMLAEKRGKEGKEAAAVLCKHGARGALLYTVNKTCTDSRAEQARERGREGETERELPGVLEAC